MIAVWFYFVQLCIAFNGWNIVVTRCRLFMATGQMSKSRILAIELGGVIGAFHWSCMTAIEILINDFHTLIVSCWNMARKQLLMTTFQAFIHFYCTAMTFSWYTAV